MTTNTKLNAPTIGAKPPPAMPVLLAGEKEAARPVPVPPAPDARGLLLDVAKIHAWPDQPRKRFPSEEKLRELGESMKRNGQLQDILVRPHAKKKGDFEIVCGECRWRAAKLVGLKTLGAKCRELDDAQALEIAVIENMHRTDVHPLEEAEGFEALMKKHGVSADEIAEKVKKSREYVYIRLKLLALSTKAREAFYADRLTSSTAVYVARIPTPAMQEQAIEEIEGMNAREAADHVRRRFMLQMAHATFDTKDPLLVEAAGDCATCPKRTKNAKEVFGDVKGSDLCTDPGCFTSKCDADWNARVEAAKTAGQVVIDKKLDGERFDAMRTPYVALDVECNQDSKFPRRTYRELLTGVKEAPAVAIGRDNETGKVVELVKRDELQKALEAKHKFARESSQNREKEERRAKEYDRSHAVEIKTRELAIAETVSRVERRQPKAAFFVAVIRALEGGDTFLALKTAIERRGLGSDVDDALESVKDEETLRGIIAELICGVPSHVEEAGREELFDAYGVELKSFEKDARAAVKAEAEFKAAAKGKKTA